MLSYSFYENDNRVRRYAETLFSAGHEVDVLCLRKAGQPLFEEDRGIRIYRIQRREKKEKGKLAFLTKYISFFARSFVILSLLQIRRRYRIVHVHNPPDLLVFAALIPKLAGARIILDIHDIMPEFYRSKFNSGPDSSGFRLLLFIEKMSAKLADHVILANHIWHSRYTSRSAAPGKCTVIMNYPDSSLFHRRPPAADDGVFTFIYPGSLNFHQGLDVAIRAFSILSKRKQKFQFRIFGSGTIMQELVALVASLGLQGKIHFYDLLPLQEIVNEIAKADCGVVPKRAGGFGDEAFSTKILEFMSMGIPVIVSETTIDRYYFNDSVVLFFKSESAEDLAEKLEQIIDNASLRNSLINSGLELAKDFSWDAKKDVYLDLIQNLLTRGRAPAGQAGDEESRFDPQSARTRPTKVHDQINDCLAQYFRCPEQYIRFALKGPLPADSGYFEFGPDAICYGGHSEKQVKRSPAGMRDASQDVFTEGGTTYLPFDPSQIADNLRFELYMGEQNTGNPMSILSQLYYFVRPLLSVAVRRHLQRLYLQGWDKMSFPRWPVDCSVDNLFRQLLSVALKSSHADRIPFIWFWPENASSCAIMTHDVETRSGRNFCPALMDINDSHGIKASFQLIPEQRYELTQEFISSIQKRGFEVAVHDLNHDGHLYRDRKEFLDRAAKINAYRKEYGADGFRAGVLYRKQTWYEALEFSYDMSVPNVAHLDPQRGGCCTVMPYFIGDVLELPVTTTQDYTLFHILNDYSIDLWKRQIDLIMAKNGLISFIVHPDYIVTSRERNIYEALLSYVTRLAEKMNIWITTPGEVNRWWRQRAEMRLIKNGEEWQIEGHGAERARIAYAVLNEGCLAYEVDEFPACKNMSR